MDIAPPAHAYAHVSEDGTRTQTVYEHLHNTAVLAAGFGKAFGAAEQAYLAGMLHDIGKYSAAFQRRLAGSTERVDHSTAGAKEAFARRQPEVAFAVAGHHAGLPDGGSPRDTADRTTLTGRVHLPVDPCDRWRTEMSLPTASPPDGLPPDSFTRAFYTRMLYSCLVDADYLDTEAFMNGAPVPRGGYEPPQRLLQKLEAYVSPWWEAKTDLNRRRCAILRACLAAGRNAEKGLFTLTVPTGGGKTVSSLAFALSMAAAQRMERIIYVIPYTSIIDQNAAVFTEILGTENVLEHHAGAEYATGEGDGPAEYRKALAAENWDVPVVVTTAVQFFESLYANRPSRCRKLHNMAGSVLVFDEAQTLPVPYLRPCVAAIVQLVRHYGAAAVLCTATQPALEPLFGDLAPDLPIREICPAPERQAAVFRRTCLRDLGELTREAMAGRLNAARQVLCVLNRRKTVQELYTALEEEGRYCLTTLLYPAHRKRLLDEIRARLKAGLPCRVVSTSLVEAGVDLDFPEAYRELAGLDSILQTAGRCNREGGRTAEESPVYVFRLEKEPPMPMLAQNIASARRVLRDFDDPAGAEAIERYFTFYRTLKGEAALDEKGIVDGFARGLDNRLFPFATAARRFQLIETPAVTVYIPLDEGAALVEELRQGRRSRALFRRLGRYGVNVYPDHRQALEKAGLLERLDEEVLVLADPRCYDTHSGLPLDVGMGIGFFA